MALNEDFLLELRERADIVSVVSPYVNLKRSSKTYVGLCPFHSEKTPSFNVYPENNSFYCFGCGAGGSVITFVCRIENLDYIDAVKSLARKFGLNMPEDGYDDTLSRRRGRILSANREAARFYHSELLGERGRAALDYLLNRGLTMQTIRRFGLGYAPNGWTPLLDHLSQSGYTEAELIEANLVRKSEKNGKTSYFDNFRHRVMVPIIDIRGGVIAFGGRVLDDSKPKYINTSDTLVYKKSRELFALNYAKNSLEDGRLILAEGYMDVIALHQAGFTNSVAGLGTALTSEQAQLLARYAKEIILSYDSDEAGQKAVRRAIPILSGAGLKVKVLKLSGGKDPDEIIKNHGRERFKSLIDGAANDIEYKMLAEREKFDVGTDDGKLSFLKAAVNVLASADGAIEREIYASRLADEFSVNKSSILLQVDEARKRLDRQKKRDRLNSLNKTARSMGIPPDIPSAVSVNAAKSEMTLLSILLNNPDFFIKISGSVSAEDFSDELHGRLFKVLMERAASNKSIELDLLNAYFTPNEMSRIVRLNNDGARQAASLGICFDCIKIIKEEKMGVEKVNPAELSDEDFNNLFKSFNK
jgi:DNA primase